jgi:hypothetical protein
MRNKTDVVSRLSSLELLKLLEFLWRIRLPLFQHALERVGSLPLLRIKNVTALENWTSESID